MNGLKHAIVSYLQRRAERYSYLLQSYNVSLASQSLSVPQCQLLSVCDTRREGSGDLGPLYVNLLPILKTIGAVEWKGLA